MSSKLIISIIFIITFVSAFGKSEAETDGGVLVLNEKNIFSEGLMRDWLLVEFYAPWCGHCQKMEPIYSEAAKMLQLHSPMLHVGKINVDENKRLQHEYQIQKFPTFAVFKNGNFLEIYEGSRTAKGIYNEVVKHNHAEASETSCAIITKMKKKARQFTIVYFGPKDHPFYEGIYLPLFEDLMTNDPREQKARMNVRYSSDKQCAIEMGLETYPAIMLYRDFDDKLQEYASDQPATLEDFAAWRFKFMVPYPFQLTQHADLSIGQGHPTILLFRADSQADEDYSLEFQEAALELQGKTQIYFAYTNLDDAYPEKLAKYFNIERSDMPQIRLSAGGMKFKPYHFTTRNATAQLIQEFVMDVFTGKTTQYLRNQKPPKYNDGAVRILNTESLSSWAATPDTAYVILYWKPSQSLIEGIYRPMFWEIAEEYEALNMTGPGKIHFGEFNDEENEVDSDSELIADMTFLNNDKSVFATFSENLLGHVDGEKVEESRGLNRDHMKAWFDDIYFSKLEGYVKPEPVKEEESKKDGDEVKDEL